MARLKVASRVHDVKLWSHDSIDEIKAGQFVDMHVNADSVSNFEWDMVADGMDFKLVSADLQADIEAANNGKVEGRHSLTQFNNYDEVKDWVKGLAAANDNVDYVEFGTTHEGRDIFALEIGTGSKVTHIVVSKMPRLFIRSCQSTVAFMPASGRRLLTVSGLSMA